jgi:transposase
LNVLKPNKKTTIQTLLARGASQREIAQITGIDRKTIRKYQAAMPPANSPGMATGSPPAQQPMMLAQNPPPRPPAHTSACEPWREFIQAQLALKRNAMAIYQDLVDLHGFAHAYNSVKRFVAQQRTREPEQFDRLEFAPGEEAQVDYGEGAPTLDAATGRWKRPRLFVMTLRYSRRSFRRVVWKSGQQEWAELHEQAFRYFGGVVRYVVLDNLKEGVLKPDLYEPELNPVYAALLAHYGCVADPARVRDPNRKGSVENAIQHTQDTALKGRRFDSLQAQNEFLERWECKWAAKRIHGREKRQVQAMYEEERASLLPLPITHFAFFREMVRTVCDDTTVRVDSSNYAARPAAIGSKVTVRLYAHLVEIRDRNTGALLRTHARSERPGATVLPDEERPFNPSRQTELLWKLAREIGPSCLELCQQWFAREGRVGQRRMWGLVGLARHHPPALVERACAMAAQQRRATLKAITGIVGELAETAAPPPDPKLTQSDALIRDAGAYADFFAAATADVPAAAGEWLQ